jgi:hypothetical protein
MKAKILFLMSALLLAAPAFATEDQEANSGFGSSLFEGKGAPAFEDPDFFDIDSLTNIAPAAGGNVNVIDSTGAAAEDSPAGDTVAPAHKPDPDAPIPGGMSSTISTR